jgi:hypothetical protein
MGAQSTDKIYTIPRGFVTADPGRNRYVRMQGTSPELPPRLNPEYSRDMADPKNAIDKVGVATDLAKIGLGSTLAGVPVRVGEAMAGAVALGLDAWDELRKSERKK